MSDIDGVLDDRDALWGQCGAYDEQVERMAATIRIYRGAVRYWLGEMRTPEVIANAERTLTGDDRDRIAQENTDANG